MIRLISCFLSTLIVFSCSSQDREEKKLLSIAQDYQHDGKLDSAITCYTKLIEDYQSNPLYLSNIGAVFNEKGEYEKAVSYLDRAIVIAPEFEAALINRSFAYMREGNLKSCELDLKKILSINPNSDIATWRLGYVYYYSGNYEDSYVMLKKTSIEDIDTYMKLSRICNYINKWDEAILFADKVLEVEPRMAEAVYSKGQALYGLAQYRESIEYFEHFLKLSPNDVGPVYVNLFVCYQTLENLDSACFYLNKAIEESGYEPSQADSSDCWFD